MSRSSSTVSAVTLFARIENSDGSYSEAVDITAITAKSYDLDTDELVKTTSIDPDEAVVALNTGQGWSRDSVGWNVKLALSGEHWPEGGRVHRVEVTYQPVNGDSNISLQELQCVNVMGR